MSPLKKKVNLIIDIEASANTIKKKGRKNSQKSFSAFYFLIIYKEEIRLKSMLLRLMPNWNWQIDSASLYSLLIGNGSWSVLHCVEITFTFFCQNSLSNFFLLISLQVFVITPFWRSSYRDCKSYFLWVICPIYRVSSFV